MLDEELNQDSPESDDATAALEEALADDSDEEGTEPENDDSESDDELDLGDTDDEYEE